MKRFYFVSAVFSSLLLSIWHLLVLAKVWSPVLLPESDQRFGMILRGAAEDGTLLQSGSMVTMRRLFWLATSSAIAAGLAASGCWNGPGSSFAKTQSGVLAPWLARRCPSVCWIPLALLWFRAKRK